MRGLSFFKCNSYYYVGTHVHSFRADTTGEQSVDYNFFLNRTLVLKVGLRDKGVRYGQICLQPVYNFVGMF